MTPKLVHRHRDVQGGVARAAVFGISDGLVSNVALILAFAGAGTEPGLVRVAGVAGLLAGAISMASGEFVSLKAQAELVERELEIERASIRENPEMETQELASIYRERGLDPEQADRVAAEFMSDPEVALDVHAREELGVDPTQLGDPVPAALVSFGAFAVGASVPLVPWLVGEGTAAVWASALLGAGTAALVGAVLARLTERLVWRMALRLTLVASGACGATYLIGNLLGATVA